MAQDPIIPLMDHELAPDEVAWMQAVYQDFSAARSSFADPKEALRTVLGRDAHRLPEQMDLAGPGPWRGGRNRHGRNVTAVFLPRVEEEAEDLISPKRSGALPRGGVACYPETPCPHPPRRFPSPMPPRKT